MTDGQDAYQDAERAEEELEDGTLDPDEVDVEPREWDEGADDEL